MTKTQAAHDIALQVVVFARKHQQPITRDGVFGHLSECGGGHRGSYLQQAAQAANYKTVLRAAIQMARQQGDYNLIGA